VNTGKEQQGEGDRPLDAERLTWAALLGRWVEFARSAVALPVDEEGRRMRASVADIIMLQAVWFALQHLGELDHEQRALGLDRAGVLIEKHRAMLLERWGGRARLPALLVELMDDAGHQLQVARKRGGGGANGAGETSA
jgi:hypothetical protein